jgi:electron transport complex protein RnfG
MLAVVNAVTKETIDENTAKEKTEAISRIFGEIDDASLVEDQDHELYLVTKDAEVLGYTVTVKPQGYGGEIEMLVGLTPDKKVAGIQIISMSETPGVGSKIKSDPNFLTQFTGRGEVFTIGENVDAISGASISSRAATAGINEALNVDFDIEEAAKKLMPEEPDTAEEAATDEETSSPAPAPVVTEETKAPEPDTYIDPNIVGAGEAAYNNYPSDNISVEERDTTYFMEHETTDTESETEVETDENGEPIEPVTDEDGAPTENA